MPDKSSAKYRYTVFLEFCGTTSVSQNEARNPQEALRKWSVRLLEPDAYGLSKAAAKSLKTALDQQEGDSLVGIEGLSSVWCTTVLVKRDLAFLHVVGHTQ